MKLKICLMFLLFTAFLPLAFAEIKISNTPLDIYNLGDTIPVSASVKQTEHLQGLFKLTISCGDYVLTYSAIPLILESGIEREIEIPLTLIGPMVGECEIIANYESIDSFFTEEKISNKFTVTTELDIEIVTDKSKLLPEEEVTIFGTVKRKNGEHIGNESVLLNFQNKDYKTNAKDGRFTYKITISPNARSGKQTMLFLVKDKNGNKGELSKEIEIIAVPSRLDFKLNKKSFKPLEALEITLYLYDQSDSPIEEEVSLKIINPKRKTIVETDMLTNNIFNYTFEQQALPGKYILEISKEKLSKEDSITVTEVEDLDIKLNGNIVFIKNIGNVEYEDTTTIILESETKKYVLNKKLRLEPGEIIEIDLSKEVKEDAYDVTLPTTSEEQNIIKNVTIQDNRGLIKKTTQGLAGITGYAVVLGNKIFSKPALLIVVIVLSIIILYIIRKFKQE